MITTYNDITNTFGFAGARGYGPGKHKSHEFLSSHQFGRIANATSRIGWVCGYNYYASEGHISCFYGEIVFKAIDGTMSAFLDASTANYGINLEYDTTDTTSVADVYNITDKVIEIPLNSNLSFEADYPFMRMSPIYNNASLIKYRPVFAGFDYTTDKHVKVALFDCESGSFMEEPEYSALGDRELRLHVFGFRHIYKEDL